ncbi:MAG: hypothetical protein IMY71_13525 [Bacteroidetes bacterium]|nr:hypothetical protein [Bacteroidota bacterium]
MRNFCLFLYLFLFTFGCISHQQSENTIIVENFPINVLLEGERITIPPILLDPDVMHISDSILIVLQVSGKKKLEFFQLPDCKYLKRYGNEGKGPEDFIRIASGTFSVGAHKNLILLDRLKRVRFFNCGDIHQDNWKPYREIDFPHKLSHTFQLVYDGDSILYGHASNEEINSEVFAFNVHSQKESSFIKYPDNYVGMSNYDKSRIYIQRLGIKPDGLKLVSAYYYFKKIRIYNIKSKSYIELIYKDSPKDENISSVKMIGGEYDIRHYITFFMGDLRVSNRYIYAEMYNEKISNLGNHRSTLNTEIHIFDWSGKPVAKCTFDEPIDCYAVTQDDKYLYAVNAAEEGVIRRYSLKEIFK